ncbi:unnamed protein product [Adineta ricciae]|uniref:Exocyst complex component Sec6 n=1 Tax=Adineta ricciae TaxID=249248 RepID=A0A814PAH2_ADIRI|nr:unnamed protein product [Adineta ricciae]CAF1102988.1 unnamed protein product [Adineta ricciae]
MESLAGVTAPSTSNSRAKLLDEMSHEAETNALRIIQAKLEKPEGLERLDQLRTAASQRKYALDEQLRTAVQSQLEDINTGITQLQNSLRNMRIIEHKMYETDEILQKIISLQSKLDDLCHEAHTYQQLALAQVNLDHIIKTPENVNKAADLLAHEKLLQAHQLVIEIENTRNYLLFELHQTQDGDSHADNIQLVTNYFADHQRLVGQLEQLISSQISRWYHCAISAPEQLVTALRLIEREEQIDRFWAEKKNLTGFSPPDRPRQWRMLCFDLLRKSVKHRIEGIQLETKEEEQCWLEQHFKRYRRMFLQDFRIITKTCSRCFPKQYDIVNRFLGYYHNCLKEHITEICNLKQRNEGETLTIADVFALVTFVRDYQDVECLRSPELRLDTSHLSPLLEKDMLVAITDVFINEMKQKVPEWMSNTISRETKDWYALKEVDLTPDHYYYTSMPRTLNNLIIQTLDMAKKMSDEICQIVLEMILEKLNEFHISYMNEIDLYTKKYFADRQSFRDCFTKQMVANANDCESMSTVIDILRKYDHNDLDDLSSSSQQQLNRYENIAKVFKQTAKSCCDIILQEIEIDTSNSLRGLFTRDWFSATAKSHCGTIIETTRDYWSSELTHLKKALLTYLFYTWHKRILAHYLRNVLSQSITIKFERSDERRQCATQLRSEASLLEKEFKSWIETSSEGAIEYHFHILSNIADILEQTDLDSIVLELATLAKKYPSLTKEQVIQLLRLRGDFTKQEARDKADAALAKMPRVNQGILSELSEIINQMK